MRDQGYITDFSISVWGKQVPQEGTTATDGLIHDRIDEFETWSEQTGTSLSVTFQRTEGGTMLNDDRQGVITLPILCLVEYQDDQVDYVSPCMDNGRVCTVAERLEAIERGQQNIQDPSVARS
jgi:hypothetical protein